MSEEATNSELQRALGRIEGAVTGISTTVQSLDTRMQGVQSGIAAIVQDNVTCHEDRVQHGKRLSAVEKKLYVFSGASGLLGTIAGFVANYVIAGMKGP